MEKKFEIPINMKFNQSFTYGEDINDIQLEQKSENNEKSEIIIKASNCIAKNENKDLTCKFIFENGLEYKSKTKNLNVIYYNRCNEDISLGYATIMKANKKESNLSSTFLQNLKIYLMGKYKNDKETLITFLYDSTMKNQKIFIEEYISDLANIYTEFIFTIIDWKDGDFIANHLELKTMGIYILLLLIFLMIMNLQEKLEVMNN